MQRYNFLGEKESLFYRFFLYQQLMITRLVFSKSKLFCTFAIQTKQQHY